MLTTELELALHRPREPAELTAALRSALEETERLSRLAHDLLMLAGTDQTEPVDQRTPRRPAIPLRPVLDATLARYRTTTDQDTTLLLDCPQDLTARVDTDDLSRAVANLIDNALRHGAVPVILTARPSHAPGEHRVHIEVRDHGPGIDPDFLPRALERFTRADPARTGAGAGLGLAITAALAHRNHATLTATNHPDGGAHLTLTLPAPTPPSPPPPADHPPTKHAPKS